MQEQTTEMLCLLSTEHVTFSVRCACRYLPVSDTCQSLTMLSRLPVATKRPSGDQLMLQMMRLWALLTLPRSLSGGSPGVTKHHALHVFAAALAWRQQ